MYTQTKMNKYTYVYMYIGVEWREHSYHCGEQYINAGTNYLHIAQNTYKSYKTCKSVLYDLSVFCACKSVQFGSMLYHL